MIHTYTTYDEVRATLGVSDEELEDTTLELPVWSTNLDFALEEVSSELVATYTAISDKPTNDRTAAESKLYAATRLYATYIVADDLLKSLPMFSFKRVTDGKAEAERFDAWEYTRDGVKNGLATIRRRLELALSNVIQYTPPVKSSYRFVIATGLAVNPVTE